MKRMSPTARAATVVLSLAGLVLTSVAVAGSTPAVGQQVTIDEEELSRRIREEVERVLEELRQEGRLLGRLDEDVRRSLEEAMARNEALSAEQQERLRELTERARRASEELRQVGERRRQELVEAAERARQAGARQREQVMEAAERARQLSEQRLVRARREAERAAAVAQERLRLEPLRRLGLGDLHVFSGCEQYGEEVLDHAEELGLTEDQEQRIRDLQRDHRRADIRREADIEIADLELEDLYEDDNVDLEAIEARLRELANLRVEDQMADLRLHRAVREQLTAEQIDQLDEMDTPGAFQLLERYRRDRRR